MAEAKEKTVKLEPELHQKAKEFAVKKQISLQEFVQSAVRDALRQLSGRIKNK